ncbi:MAG: hypothetical protein A3H68_02835 [Candidatus Taylorbacteria bacterium RIFCSPLOWO2_02_FULL_46_40]|uniref:SMC-Scp complex subunit ScpB n=1 Tax=Candidatus Taylorbacteria bacterium RIFCSPLOWO2_02_FULL_46_40 TaxID=1802329 RepID=A0A1G2NY52_9BACT|nr:MAG: hypothetical protein A3H68_02835 [Candidatus Taylorbacteria bacterium RIFCSPLOWO2_02_FULL_46_40]
MNKLEQQIEALLFWIGEPLKKSELAKLCDVSAEQIGEAVKNLPAHFSERGIVFIENDDEISLGASPDVFDVIEKARKEELSREIGKAGLETLAIIVHKKDGATRRQIDFVRGVNSSFILRNLLVRGLVQKFSSPAVRGYAYKPTTELLSWLGVTKIEDIEGYAEIKTEMDNFEASLEAASPEGDSTVAEASIPVETTDLK